MSSSSKQAYQTSQVATIMNATQQVKEKRGARAHAHEARAGKNANTHEFQAADCPQNSLCQFWGAFTEETIDSRTSCSLAILKLQQLEFDLHIIN